MARYSEALRGPQGRWRRLRLPELAGRQCYCHCKPEEACHVDEVIRAFQDEAAEAERRGSFLPALEGMCLAEAGLTMKSVVCWSRDPESAGREHVEKGRGDFERGGRGCDLLPFPLSLAPSTAEVELSMTTADGSPPGQATLQAAGIEAWMFLVKWSLSWVYGGRPRGRPSPDRSEPIKNLDPSLAQEAALSKLRDYVVDFVQGPEIPVLNWGEVIRNVKIDYNNEEVKLPELVTWARLEPALPPLGGGARVRAADLAEGWLRECLLDPSRCLLPEEDRPKAVPPARVWVESDEEWSKVCGGAADRKLFTFLKKEEILHVGGEPVLNGLFGVPKKGGTGETSPLRMIINAIPTNSLQRLLAGDIRSLPYFGQWSGIHLEEDERVVVMSELDMTAAFYVFRMEPAWWGYQALSKPVRGSFAATWRAELGDTDWVYPAVTVMMMGWKSACGLLQAFHRRLCFAPPPMGAGLDPNREVRKDGPLPRVCGEGAAEGTGQFLTVYLDNFAEGELKHVSELATLEARSPGVKAVQAAWERWGIPSQESKATLRSIDHETLGCRLDGRKGILAPPRSTLSSLLGLTSWYGSGQARAIHEAQVLGGRWVRCFQFRREASGAFEGFWDALHPEAPREQRTIPTSRVIDDLVVAMAFTPLLVFDLRARVSPLVTASDASEDGLGLCRTSALTAAGLEALAERRPGAVTPADELGLLELFSGIGGLRRALEMLGVRPGVYAAVEKDEACQRVVRAAWPDVKGWLDVEAVGESELRQLVESGPRVRLWLVGGGFPCQPHSGLNVNKKDFDDARSLHRQVPRIVGLLRKVTEAEVAVFGECVSSMDSGVRDVISEDFGVRPLRVCPSGRLPVRRPRYYWLSWKVKAGEGVTAGRQEGADKLEFAAPPAPVSCRAWADRGWKRTEDCPLPTFVRAIPRTSPPPRPAGLEQCDEEARHRWERDEFRFAPYQYQWKYGMIEKGIWRVPSSTERERLLGFPVDHTRTALKTGEAKDNPRQLEDLRLSMLGNSFQTGVVAYLAGWLLHEHGFIDWEPTAGLLDVGRRAGPAEGANPGKELIEVLLERQMHRGRELRRLGAYENPAALPRSTLHPEWWRWRRVFGAPWREKGEHINVLEMRAVLASLNWRVRSVQNIHCRGLLAMDSQVALGALSKGRSPSWRLGPLVARVGALMMAASFVALLGYIRTDLNPADAPSRLGL